MMLVSTGRKFLIPNTFYDVIESDSFAKCYFKGSYLRPEVKKALYKAARKEIQQKTKCGMMPRRLTNKVRYFLDIIFDENTGVIRKTRIGCELMLSPDWVNTRGINASRYKKYINDWQNENADFDGNLTLICGGCSALDTIYTDMRELTTIENILN